MWQQAPLKLLVMHKGSVTDSLTNALLRATSLIAAYFTCASHLLEQHHALVWLALTTAANAAFSSSWALQNAHVMWSNDIEQKSQQHRHVSTHKVKTSNR